jgi:ribosomal protein S18 acetylase RimI-like enzyme
MTQFRIEPLASSAAVCTALSEILIETVAHGGSVSFVHPLSREAASRFWTASLGQADRGERIVLGAFDRDELIGTVTLLLDLPPNQPHRAEIAKMMTRLSHRHRGAATALLDVAEKLAIERSRTLLVLDTAVDDGASALYERMGFQLAGIIPDYALKPHGGLTGTMIYWKRLAPAQPALERADLRLSQTGAADVRLGSRIGRARRTRAAIRSTP